MRSEPTNIQAGATPSFGFRVAWAFLNASSSALCPGVVVEARCTNEKVKKVRGFWKPLS
jgi:hypothetical protein